jgi:hypothetical protein
MPPGQGCYEERYRLTVPVARDAAFSLAVLIPALFSHQPLGARRRGRGRRPITAWRLDRDRLAALTAAVAPGIPLVIALPVLGDIKSYHPRRNGNSLTAAQLSHVRPWRPWADTPNRSSWSIPDRSTHELCIDHGASPR